tara:strand:- start:1618 stop:2313 length:696 start_codon:yes stop_codon:yes gene_type:complete
MSNALTSFISKANVPVLSDTALADAIEQGQQANNAAGRDSSGAQYLSFSGKTGIYALGQEKGEIDPDAMYLFEPMSLLAGWICWKNSKPVGRTEWSFYSGNPVKASELEDHGPYDEGDGWKELLGFGCLALDGTKAEIKFSSNAVSAKNSITDLIEKVKVRSKAKEPALPVFSFGKEKFEAQGKWNFKPTLPVEAWVTREASALFFEGTFSMDDLLAGKKPTSAQLKKLAA